MDQLTQTPTLSAAIAYAWPEIEVSLSKTATGSYRSHLDRFRSLWGDRRLDQLEPRELALYVGNRRLQVRPATVRHELTVLRRVLQIARRDGARFADPLQGLSLPRDIYHRTNWLCREIEGKLYQVLDPAWASLVQFGINTGLRRLEQFQLRRSDVNFASSSITVRAGKTRRTRVVPLNPVALATARLWLDNHGEEHVFLPGWDCRSAAGAVATRKLKEAASRIGLQELWWRDLRHTFASRLVQRGVPLFHVQQLLGHTSPNMTMRYAHVGDTPLRQAVMMI